MLFLAVTVLTGATAFSPPPVPIDTLSAEPAGAVRSFPDGTPLEQAVLLNETVLLNEHEQKQEQLLSLEPLAADWGARINLAMQWFGRAITDSEFLELFGEDDSGEEGEGTFEVEGESYAVEFREFIRADLLKVIKAEEEEGEAEKGEEGESYGERKEKTYHAPPQGLGKVLLADGEEGES